MKVTVFRPRSSIELKSYLDRFNLVRQVQWNETSDSSSLVMLCQEQLNTE